MCLREAEKILICHIDGPVLPLMPYNTIQYNTIQYNFNAYPGYPPPL